MDERAYFGVHGTVISFGGHSCCIHYIVDNYLHKDTVRFYDSIQCQLRDLRTPLLTQFGPGDGTTSAIVRVLALLVADLYLHEQLPAPSHT